MKIDTTLSFDLARAAKDAARAEDAGYDGIFTAETSSDPFLPLVVAAEHTSRIELGTSIAVAFARSPMTAASTAYDLNKYAEGRFILGLGSQIKPHITKRFSMPWSQPAARMREFVLAMRAIWHTWETGEKLAFEGDFYTHTLMTPFFNPGPNEFGAPKVILAGVGPMMTRVAGETCDGFFCHGFTTERYLREVTVPTLTEGRELAGKTLDGFEVCLPAFVVSGTTDEETEAARQGVKGQIAFYGSTPAYRRVLELHGWGDLQPQLNALSKQGDWQQMGELIDDDVLDAFAVVAEPDGVAAGLKERFGDTVDRLSFYMPYATDRDMMQGIIDDLRG